MQNSSFLKSQTIINGVKENLFRKILIAHLWGHPSFSFGSIFAPDLYLLLSQLKSVDGASKLFVFNLKVKRVQLERNWTSKWWSPLLIFYFMHESLKKSQTVESFSKLLWVRDSKISQCLKITQNVLFWI